jgi:hypothetical protein
MPAFALTIFTGAFLLFQVQPLIGKFILPWYGGGPAVWTTCMLFFQIFLLGGYAWAHFCASRLQPRSQAIAQIVLVVVALALLPIVPGEQWKPKPGGDPTWHILALLAANLGLPYLLLSTTGPLMQEWYSRIHPGAFPYRLYALSNVGSLLALVSYPFVVEPHLTRQQQSRLWSVGLLLYGICSAWCAWKLIKAGTQKASVGNAASEAPPPPTWRRRLFWMALPACASALLLATTNKICQDVAVIPFLWIIPLALYLLSFIIAFDSPRWYKRWIFYPLLTAACAGAAWGLKWGADAAIHRQVLAFCTVLFFASVCCHGELFRLKPHPRFLTSYYLMISAGGALGGLFVAVVAPNIFTSYFEYHWALYGCWFLLLLISVHDAGGRPVKRWRVAGAVSVALATLWVTWILIVDTRREVEKAVVRQRNFYGVLSVYEYNPESPDSHYLTLQHGRITHGFQFVESYLADQPVSYFGETSGIGLALRHFPRQKNMHIGLAGMGIGTIAAYGKPGDRVRIYEINPAIRQLAMSKFRYVSKSKAQVDIIMGDARLSMEKEPRQDFDVLILDAFSGDAVPIHLITREAFEIYLKHLRPDGIIAVNITNRYLDLQPVVENLAKHFNLTAASFSYDENDEEWWLYGNAWILVTRNEEFLKNREVAGMRVPKKEARTDIPLWTDDFASLFQILEK